MSTKTELSTNVVLSTKYLIGIYRSLLTLLVFLFILLVCYLYHSFFYIMFIKTTLRIFHQKPITWIEMFFWTHHLLTTSLHVVFDVMLPFDVKLYFNVPRYDPCDALGYIEAMLFSWLDVTIGRLQTCSSFWT